MNCKLPRLYLLTCQICQPLEILISFARTYTWQTESLKDQERFLSTLVSLFFEAFGPNAPLQITGFNPSNPCKLINHSVCLGLTISL